MQGFSKTLRERVNPQPKWALHQTGEGVHKRLANQRHPVKLDSKRSTRRHKRARLD